MISKHNDIAILPCYQETVYFLDDPNNQGIMIVLGDEKNWFFWRSVCLKIC